MAADVSCHGELAFTKVTGKKEKHKQMKETSAECSFKLYVKVGTMVNTESCQSLSMVTILVRRRL